MKYEDSEFIDKNRKNDPGEYIDWRLKVMTGNSFSEYSTRLNMGISHKSGKHRILHSTQHGVVRRCIEVTR